MDGAKVLANAARVLPCVVALWMMGGCATADPASRVTSSTHGDININVGENAAAEIKVTLGDGAIASADSSGSTETQTATPTNTVDVPVTIKYNDAIAGANAASRNAIGLIGTGLDGVLALMQSKQTGTVAVTKTDGTAATIKCEGGQCYECTDCTP